MFRNATGNGFSFCAERDEAKWIASSPLEFDLLVTRGPGHFESYARALLLVDPESSADAESDAAFAGEQRSVLEVQRDIVAVLQHFTESVMVYALVADNGVSRMDDAAAKACVMTLGGVRYFLAAGPISGIESWFEDLELDEADHPSFLWPEDRSWCLASDREVRFVSIASSTVALAAVDASPLLSVAAWPPGSDGREFIYMN
ncbi:hypothetical protein [Demequina sp. NBRC 110052]|uniref:hypothetical protein n=1 Tax=Demequina sp. NBRC 110052 TaxID=1570341 RepID=UPI0009FD1DFC|nr:hypothetical protein [Demequina sp. NBRC 110052]